jgi:hypothetical protein
MNLASRNNFWSKKTKEQLSRKTNSRWMTSRMTMRRMMETKIRNNEASFALNNLFINTEKSEF